MGDPPQGPVATPRAKALPPAEILRLAAERARFLAKVRLLHVRYVAGYLAAGFGISAPITLGYQIHGTGDNAGELIGLAALSVLYGGLFGLPFLALEPVTRIAWERMRVPEFRMFELAVTRTAAILSALLFVASLVAIGTSSKAGAGWLPPGLTWTVFALMAVAWARIKVQTLLFPEFYADRGGEHVLEPPAPEGPPEAKPPGPAPEPGAGAGAGEAT